jgi:hypothetical protein
MTIKKIRTVAIKLLMFGNYDL